MSPRKPRKPTELPSLDPLDKETEELFGDEDGGDKDDVVSVDEDVVDEGPDEQNTVEVTPEEAKTGLFGLPDGPILKGRGNVFQLALKSIPPVTNQTLASYRLNPAIDIKLARVGETLKLYYGKSASQVAKVKMIETLLGFAFEDIALKGESSALLKALRDL